MLTFNPTDMSVRLSLPKQEKRRRTGLRLAPAATVLAIAMEQSLEIPAALWRSSKGAEFVRDSFQILIDRGTHARSRR